MRKWKSSFLSALLLLMIGINAQATSSYYDNYCYPCNWKVCDQGVLLGADFIFWKPCIDDLDVAAFLEVDTDANAKLHYKCMCLDWEPGVRVYLALPKLFCDWDLFGSYTYLHSCNRMKQKFEEADVQNGIVSPLIFTGIPNTFAGPFEDGKQRWDLWYHDWDVLISHDILCGKCHRFSPYFGIAGIYLDQELKAKFSLEVVEQTKVIVKWDSEYWGVGLRFGTYYEYTICDGLGLFADANAALLAGEACSFNKQIFSVEGEEFSNVQTARGKDDNCCLFVPGYRIAAGFTYSGCLCNCGFGARLGYEFVFWHNVPNHRVFTDSPREIDASGIFDLSGVSHSSSPNTRTLGFHGLIAGLYVSF